nr:RNA-directed DNA polymerase, eukaryota, reverse transcriptase zinc-binding domain protein [Tanacetum cinerariifolium]
MLVLQRIKSIRCHFFNGNDLDSKRSIWVSWNKVLTSKEKGGLGVSSLFALNRALMFKWVWQFFNQRDSLWVRVIHAIHGIDGRIGRAGNVGYTSIWCDIIKEMDMLASHGIDLISMMHKKIGNRMPRSGIESEQWVHLLDSLEGVMLNPSEDSVPAYAPLDVHDLAVNGHDGINGHGKCDVPNTCSLLDEDNEVSIFESLAPLMDLVMLVDWRRSSYNDEVRFYDIFEARVNELPEQVLNFYVHYDIRILIVRKYFL